MFSRVKQFRLVLAARKAGVKEDFGPQGTKSEHPKHTACGSQLHLGRRKSDGAVVYWCAVCMTIVRVLDRPPYNL